MNSKSINGVMEYLEWFRTARTILERTGNNERYNKHFLSNKVTSILILTLTYD